MAKYLSGRVQRAPQGSITSDRYNYLSLNQAEPNLGDPLASYDYPASIPSGSQYQIVSIPGYPGQRFWVPVGGGLIPGAITVYDEGSIIIPGSISSITQLNFVGAAITAFGYLKSDGSPGTISTIKVFAPGSTGQILFNSNNDFSTSSNLTFSSNTFSVIGFGSFSGIVTTGGSNNNGVRVGIAGTNIIDTVSGNLILTANNGITSISSNLLASGISSFTNTVSLGNSVGIGTNLPTTNLQISGDMRLTGTIYDYNNNPGVNNQILLKNNFGGLIWTNQSSIQSGAGGTYTQVQYNNSAGLVDGASNFVYNPINNRVGIGSTLPQYLLDVGNGTVNIAGFTTLSNLYVSGIATFSNTFNIAATTDSTSTTTGALVVSGGVGISKNLNVGGATTLTNLNVSGLTITNNLIVTGISTLGFITGTSAYFSGIITANTFNGKLQGNADSATYASSAGFSTNAGISTSVISGIASVTQLNVSGISTLGSTSATNLTSQQLSISGISTLGFITASNAYLSGIVTSNKLNVTGFTTLTTMQVSGISTFGDKILPVNVGTQDIGSQSNYWNNIYATTFVGRIIGIANSSDTLKITADTTNTSRYLTFSSVSTGYTGALTNTNLTFNPGNQFLGIGVNNPQYTLHANSGSLDIAFLGNNYGALLFGCDSSGTRYVNTSASSSFEFRNNSSPTVRIDSSGNFLIATTSASGTANQLLQVNSGAYINGRLGIGITNPTSNFQVSGTSLITGISTFGDKVLPTNNGTQDLGSSSQKWNNVYANNFIGIFQGTASKADALSTARTISITGDVLYTSPAFDGTANVSAAGTLSNTGVIAGNYGSQSGIATFTVDSKGRITGAGTTTLNASAINAAGSNTQLQFNDNSVFGASSNLTFNKTTNTLTLLGNSYISGISTANTLVATGIVTTNQLAVTGVSTFYSQIVPATTNINIGSVSQVWNNVYANTFNGSFQGTASFATTATNVIGGIGSITQLQVTGISTFTNGPVLIGSVLTTGTASQPLQVTGGAYISQSIGIGTTNSQAILHTQNSTLTRQDGGLARFLAPNLNANADNSIAFGKNFADSPTATLWQSGLLGYKFDGISNSTSNSYIFLNIAGRANTLVVHTNDNVGVGTTNPQYKLDVYGSGHYTGNLTVDGTINATISGTVTQVNITSDTASSSANYLTFVSGNTTGSYGLKDSSNLAYIPSSGNLGVGLNAPSQKLDVYGNIRLGSNISGSSATPSYIDLGINYSNGTTRDKCKIYLYNSGTEQYGFGVGGSGDVQYHSNTTHDFYISNTKIATVNSTAIIPQGSYDLGGTGNRWNNVYATTFNGTFQGNASTATYATTSGIATNLGSLVAQNWQIPYQSAANTTLFTTGGSTGQLLQFNSTSAPTWVSTTALSVNYAATAGVATNLSGTTANSIPYQSASSTTTYLSPPISGSTYVLTSSGGAPIWSTTIPSSTVAAGSNTQVQYNNSGSLGASANFTFNSSTNLLAITAIKPGQIQDSGGGTGASNYVLAANGTGGWSWSPVTGTGAISGIAVQQGGTTIGTGITTLNFSGATVTTSSSTATITITATPSSVANLSGGTANAIPYQSAPSTTTFLNIGSTNQVLAVGSNGTPTWSNLSSLPGVGVAASITVTSDATSATNYLTYVNGNTTGTYGLKDSSNLTYNPTLGLQVQPSLGVGAAAPSGTAGEIRASNNITAYYSDERLKENIKPIPSALSKLLTLRGVTFNSNKVAEQYGYIDKKEQVGVIAQDIEKVLPQIVVPAPFDIGIDEDGNEYSKSGENYKTVHYDKITPLLIEAIKEQQQIIDKLEKRIQDLESR